jgi:hypothetical protein
MSPKHALLILTNSETMIPSVLETPTHEEHNRSRAADEEAAISQVDHNLTDLNNEELIRLRFFWLTNSFSTEVYTYQHP